MIRNGALTMLAFSLTSLQGTTLVSLDNSNNFSADVVGQLTLVRSSQLSGAVTITGGNFLGRNSTLLSTPSNSIQTFGNNIAAGDVFLIESSATGDQFNAELVFFARPRSADLGSIPAEITATSVGAAFDVSPIPEPTSALLLSLAGLGLMRRRRS